jgi:hypothetical protein
VRSRALDASSGPPSSEPDCGVACLQGTRFKITEAGIALTNRTRVYVDEAALRDLLLALRLASNLDDGLVSGYLRDSPAERQSLLDGLRPTAAGLKTRLHANPPIHVGPHTFKAMGAHAHAVSIDAFDTLLRRGIQEGFIAIDRLEESFPITAPVAIPPSDPAPISIPPSDPAPISIPPSAPAPVSIDPIAPAAADL